MMDFNHPYLKNMLLCGSNKRTDELDWSDKLTSIVKGDGSEFVPPVYVTFKHGVKRKGYPVMYLPGLDYTDEDGYAKIGVRFTDTGKLEVLRFRLFQLFDENPFFRMTGNTIPFHIDLTQTGAVKMPLPNKGYMPKEVKEKLAKEMPDVWKEYIKPFIYGYERALVKIESIYTNIIRPLEDELQQYKYGYYMNKDTDVGGLAEYKRKMVDGQFTEDSGRSNQIPMHRGYEE